MSEQSAFDRYQEAVGELHDATPNGYTSTPEGRAKADEAFDKFEKAERDLSASWRRR